MDSLSKRTKTDLGNAPVARILRPFRIVGLVTNSVPCSVASLGQTYTVSTVVGKSIQIYDAASLRLLFMTQPQTTEDIECIETHFHHVFAVSGIDLLVYRRGKLEAKATIPNKQVRNKALKIIVFGGYVCVALSMAVHVFKWTAKPDPCFQFYATLSTPSLLGEIVDISHPPTYVNKLVVATQSSLVLFNVKTSKEIYIFPECDEGISLVEAAPTALDIMALATPKGNIVLYNLRTARELFRLYTNEPVTTLGFRSDGTPLVGIGTAKGDVFLYDLESKRRVQSLRGFVNGSAQALKFLPGQPLVIVSGSDNVLSELVFDPPVTNQQIGTHRARVLRRRGGHGAPSSCMLFADEEAHFLFSGSLDSSLWAFSLRKDSQNHAFGRTNFNKHVEESLGAITAMAYASEKRERWDTLITAHSSSTEAYTWSAVRGAVGKLKLTATDKAIVKSVAVSQCGNFGIIGTTLGGIMAYNLQSGHLRRELLKAHKSSVTGLALLPNNSELISTSLDGKVKFHAFKTGETLATMKLGQSAITDLRFHAASRLLAISTDSMCIVVIDVVTKRVVRELWGHANRITSFDFVPSGRCLLSASLDGTVRIWDIPSGACVNGMRLKNSVTQLRVSPTSEWVATSHVRGVGIQMWVLKMHAKAVMRSMSEEEFTTVEEGPETNTDGSQEPENLVERRDEIDGQVEVRFEDVAVEELGMGLDASPTQIGSLTTLSQAPRNKFTTLVHLDAIHERNKPQEGIKKPEKSSFFLGSADDTPAAVNSESNGVSRLTTGDLSSVTGSYTSEFTLLLHSGDLEAVAAHLESLAPAATDLEIRSLDTRAPFGEVIAFLDTMTLQLELGKRFELVQAWMRMALAAHRDLLTDNEKEVSPQLLQSYNSWLSAQKKSVEHMNEQTRFCLGVMAYLRSM